MDGDLLGARYGRMFMGTLDDSVARHPWPGVRVDLETLNHSLLFHALLGPPICCRIGNLLYTDTYFQALLNPEKSLLLPLAQVGFFQIHMRGQTINDAIQERFDERTNSTLAWEDRYHWTKDAELRARLTALDATLAPGGGKLSYTPSFRAAFEQMMMQLERGVNPSFDLIYAEWRRRYEGALTRSNFEELTLATFGRNRAAVLEAMSVINSVNHYAYGRGMGDMFREPYVDTKEVLHLEAYTGGLFGDEGRTVAFDEVEHLFRSGILKTIEKNLTIPKVLINDPALWPRFAGLFAEGERYGKEWTFGAKKTAVLDAINTIVRGKTDYEARARLADACRDYGSFIAGTLGLNNAPSAGVRFRVEAQVALGAGAGDLAADGLKEAAKQALKLAGAAATGYLGMIPINILASWAIDRFKPLAIRSLDRFMVDQLPAPITNRTEFARKRAPMISALSVRKIMVPHKPAPLSPPYSPNSG